MIVTLTPNPSLDRTITVERLRVGEVHRAGGLHIDAGGKGVNVSRALAANGFATLAVMPAHGAPAVEFTARLESRRRGARLHSARGCGAHQHHHRRLPMASLPRSTSRGAPRPRPMLRRCWKRSSATLAIAPGWSAAEACRRESTAICMQLSSSGRALAACALRLTPRAPRCARQSLLDRTSSSPIMKNLRSSSGRSLPTIEDVLDAARGLVAGGIGDRRGQPGRAGRPGRRPPHTAVHAAAVVSQPQSTVGAGDCLLAGLLAAIESGASLADALESGVRWGAAAVALPGSTVPSPGDLSLPSVTVSATAAQLVLDHTSRPSGPDTQRMTAMTTRHCRSGFLRGPARAASRSVCTGGQRFRCRRHHLQAGRQGRPRELDADHHGARCQARRHRGAWLRSRQCGRGA